MVKNTTQIAKLHNRHGKLNELPKQLGMARIGLADDTNQVFIGNDENPDLQERYDSNTFPYGNVEILTEFSPLPNIIKYSPHLDGEQIFYLIDIIGNSFTSVPSGSKILINGEEIRFDNSSDILNVVSIINNHKFNKYAVKAKNNNGKLELITFADELVLQDVVGGNTLSLLGFTNQAVEATPLTKRTLQEVLDDNFCIKAFDVKGDGETDDSIQINKAFDIVYDFSNYAGIVNKKLYFPASTYIVGGESLKVYSNTYIGGEGIDKTIIKGTGSNPIFKFSDNKTKDVIFESMTFDTSISSMNKIFELNNYENIIFKDCKFIAGENSNFIDGEVSESKNIIFKDCIFDGNSKNVSLKLMGEIDNFLILNCLFKNVGNISPIIINGKNFNGMIKNGIIANNSFENCSGNILISANQYVKYVSVVKSLVEEKFLINNNYKVFDQNDVNDYHDWNYCDTPKSTNDPNKFLRSHFYQDIYDYVQELYNKFGKKALEIISPENDIEVNNYFQIEQGTSDKKLILKSSSEDNDVVIGVGENANLHLGGESSNNDTSVIFDRNIDVNDNSIKNGKGGNIEFEVNPNTYLQIKTNEDDNYSNRIANNPNAIPNVDFVIHSMNNDNRFVLDYDEINKKISESKSSEFDLIYFDPNNYGNKVAIKDISINIRQPFIPVSEQINDALEWDNAIINYYNAGDKIYIEDTDNNKKYYLCTISHKCIFNSTDDNVNFQAELDRSPNPYWVEYTLQEGEIINDEYKSYSYVNWYEGDVVKYTNDSEILFYICLKDHYANIDYYNSEKGISFYMDINANKWKQLAIDSEDRQNYFYNYGRYTYTRDANNNVILENYIGEQLNVTLPQLLSEIKTIPDVKYITITSTDNRNINIPEDKKYLFTLDDVDINARDVNGYKYSSWVNNYEYKIGDKISYNYSNYECLVKHTSRDKYEIHNEDVWKRLNESGYDYRLNFERDLWVLDSNNKLVKEDFQLEHNFSDHTLKLALYDKNHNLIETIPINYDDLFNYVVWASNTVYVQGQYVKHETKNYVVMNSFTSGSSFETRNGNTIYLEEITKDYWASNTNYYIGQYIKSSNSSTYDVYKVIKGVGVNDYYTSGASIENDVENGYLEKMPSEYVQIGTSGKIILTINYMRGN